MRELCVATVWTPAGPMYCGAPAVDKYKPWFGKVQLSYEQALCAEHIKDYPRVPANI